MYAAAACNPYPWAHTMEKAGGLCDPQLFEQSKRFCCLLCTHVPIFCPTASNYFSTCCLLMPGMERVVFYRERGALPYDPFAYGVAIALVEIPYLLIQVWPRTAG